MKTNINLIESGKGLLIICLYFLSTAILSLPFLFLYKKNIINLELANIFTYLSISILFLIIFFKDIKKDLQNFKKDYKSILKISLNYWLKGLFIMITSSFLIAALKIAPVLNQEQNSNLLKEMPIVEILAAIIFAPIIEELVFRRGFKNFTNNKHIYAYTTGLIFGAMHIISSINGINDLPMLLYLIPYSSVGISLGYTYNKTNNIIGVITTHSLHNTITIIEMIILGGLV